MRRGKKPTRKQQDRLRRAGLSPDSWLVVKDKPNGEMVILHRRFSKVKVIPASVGHLTIDTQKEISMDYIYIGNTSGYAISPSEPNQLNVFLYDPANEKKPPTMLTAHGTLAKYFRELSDSDHEEKYMRKRFYFSSFCTLQKVEVLDYKTSKHVVKTVTEGSDFSTFID